MTHFVILVEDQSGETALNSLVPKIIGSQASFDIYSYKGCGEIPQGLKPKTDAPKRILLDRLPKLLNGLGQRYRNCGLHTVVVVVCDLDKRDYRQFVEELNGVKQNCKNQLDTYFALAVEEGEAWLLGDLAAITTAYPKAKKDILKRYKNDSICDTWELLADALVTGGAKKLKQDGWSAIGKEKNEWARKIAPHIDVAENKSPSFQRFRGYLIDELGK